MTIITSSPPKQRLISSNTPHTPNQPTIPKNPDFSGDSIESTDEDNTKRMIGTLIDTTLLCLRSDFTHVPWPKYVQNCRIRSSGYLAWTSLLTSRQERLTFVLGQKPITVINDDTINIEYLISRDRIAICGINDHSYKIRSVVSIEVSSISYPSQLIS